MTDATLDNPTPAAAAAVYGRMFGWRVAPVTPGSKVPSIRAWQNDATTSRAQIDAWWREQPDAGVCIVTGRSSGLWVLDVDVAGGKPGMATLFDLVQDHQPGERLPDTLVARTPSGGYHYYFAYPADREIRNSAGNRLGPGLDVRGEGGQVNAPPTARAEGAYRWADGRGLHEAQVLPAPAWLVDLVADPVEPVVVSAGHLPAPNPVVIGRFLSHDPPAWVDEFNRSTSWGELLDGWTEAFTDRDGVTHWSRPGKSPREGTSATTGYGGHDILYVYTTSIPWLPSDRAYDKAGFLVHRDYGGDFAAAGRAARPAAPSMAVSVDLLDQSTPSVAVPGLTVDEATEPDEQTRIEQAEMPLNTAAFWNAEDDDEDFLIAPFIGAGRAHALYAEAKAGKSYVVLQALAAASVPNHSSWAEVPDEPVSILYLDYEMTENDLRERLGIFGYGPDDDYSRLHYVKASMLGADLDTLDGGLDLLRQAQRWECQLVVVDTMSRAVSGDENDADTVRRFYQHTGRLLKAHGIAWLRIDHAGKAKDRGQRGSSGKNDDVDIVWRLDRTDEGAVLTSTHSRVFWTPGTIALSTVKHSSGAVTHVRATAAGHVEGTAEAARKWLDMGLPLTANRKQIRDAGIKFNNAHFTDLRRYVKELEERESIVGLSVCE
jgi:Bifunctional DNA primase/polymerase, N-terminal/AAA domain